MNYSNRLSILFLFLFTTHVSLALVGEKKESNTYENGFPHATFAPGDLSAIIGVPAILCAGQGNGEVIFEGTGGTPPYTFTYQIDGVTQAPISTSSSSSTVNVPVNTTLGKVFTYRITSVRGSTGKTTAVDISQQIVVNPSPEVDFSFMGNECSDTPVSFTSTVQGTGSYLYLWNFGDGQTSTAQNPSHEFNSLGCGTASFTVSLTVTDMNGCSATRSKSIVVLQKPDIGFSDVLYPFSDPFNNCGRASSGSPDYTITVGNASSSAGCVDSYTLDWGDGSAPVSNVTFPVTHTYSRLGAFHMVITAAGANGCHNAVTYVVKNMNNPSVGITSPGTTNNLCAPTAPLDFEIAKWGTNAPGTFYTVDYGDGSPVLTYTQEELMASVYYVAANPSASANFPIPHSYLSPNCPNGPFMVRLTATNACSSTEATVNNITVFNKTTPDFSMPSTACVNSNVAFINTSVPGYNTSCTQTSIYTWDFGDGSSVEITSPSLPTNTKHTYTAPGQYTVSLRSKNICGESTVTRQITILPPVLATISGAGAVSGSITVCQDAAMPVITFTGSNGTAPYTFYYRINNGPVQSITTTGSSSSVTIQVPTNTKGTFTYTLVSVQEGSPSACTQIQTGVIAVEVNEPLEGTISGSGSTCLNDPSSVITFTGANGTKPYTFTYNINGGASQTITTSGSSNSVSLPVPTHTAGVFKYNLTGIQDASTTTCSSAVSASATVTVNQPPAPLTLVDYTYCNGEITPLIPFTNAVAGTAYRWSNSNPSIGLAGSGTGNIPSFKATNPTGSPVTAIITVIPSVNDCEGSAQTFHLTIYPSAVMFSQEAQTICSGDQTVEVTLSSPTAGVEFSWTAIQPAGLTGVITSGANVIPVQTLVNTTGAPIDVIYTAVALLPATDPCAGIQYSYTVTVNPRPVIQQAFALEVCSGSAFTVSPQSNAENTIPSGTRYSWDAPAISPAGSITGAGTQNVPQGTISQTLVNTTLAPATVTYTVTPVANGCTGAPFTIVVTVVPLPTATLVGGATLCQDEAMPELTFTGTTGTAPYVFTYRINNGTLQSVTTEPSSNSVTVKVPTANAGTFTYTLVGVEDAFSCSQAQTGTAIVTVRPVPDAMLSGDLIVCGNSPSPQLTFTGSGGTRPYTFTYNIDGGESQIIATTGSSNSVNLTVPTHTSGVYKYNLTGVQDAGNCNRPVNASATVTVKEVPAPLVLSDFVFCNGETTPLVPFTNAVAGTTYSWSNSNPSIGLPASGNGNIPSFKATNPTGSPVTAIITVIPSVNDCEGAEHTFNITVYPSPRVTFPTAGQTICSGESTTAVMLGSTTAGAEFSWTAIQPEGLTGVITSGTHTIPIQTLENTTGAPIDVIYRAKATTTGTVTCPGDEYSYTVTVNPRPVIQQAFALEVCSESAFTVSPQSNAENTIPSGTRYSWSVPVINPAGALTGGSSQATSQAVISQTLINTTSAAATATYTVTPIANGCQGDPFVITVNVLPLPTVNPVSDIILCSNESSAEIVFSGSVAGTVYRWTSDNGSMGLAGSGTDRFAAYTGTNTGNSPVQAIITVTPVLVVGSVSCEGTPEQFTITVLPRAQVDHPGDQHVCGGKSSSVIFTTQNSGGATTYEWTNSNTAIGLGASGTGNLSFVPVNAGITPLTTTITVTPVFSYQGVSCKGNSETFILEVIPSATMDKPMDQVVCNGYMTDEIKFTGNLSDATYNWTIDNATIGLPVTGLGDIMPFTAINNGSVPVVATLTVTPVINGCSNSFVRFTITVNPTPVIAAQPEGSTVCMGEKAALLSVLAMNGTGTPSYQWYYNTINGTTGATLIPNATDATYDPPTSSAGTLYYYCVITFPAKDCHSLTTEPAEVTVLPNPVISAVDQEISSGDVFTVVPTWGNGNIVPPGTTYTWSEPEVSPANSVAGATAQSVPQPSVSQQLTNISPGTATVTYTVFPTSGSCTGVGFKVTVKVFSALNPHALVHPITCYGMNDGSISTSIQGGVPFSNGAPYRILWTGPNGFSSTASAISNLCPGVYVLKITDSLGKEFTESYTLPEPQEIEVLTDDKEDIACYGAATGHISITATGGTGAYHYSWTKDNAAYGTAEDIANLVAGTYVVTVTDENACKPKIITYIISQPEPLTITLKEKTDILCFGNATGSIKIEVAGGVMLEKAPGVFDYQYLWTGPGGFTSSSRNLSNIGAGNYQLMVTDRSGCNQSFSITVNEPAFLAVTTETTPISCFGANNATLRLNISGGTPPYRAEWNNYATGTFQENLSAGDYTILVTDANGCQVTTTVTIPEAPAFLVNPVVKNISCYGAHDGSVTLNMETTLKPVTLSWSDNAVSGITRNNMGPGTYTVNIKGGELCMISRTFIITEPLPLELTARVTDITDCSRDDGGAVDLMVVGGTPPYRYDWSNKAVSEDLTNITAGTYAITVTDATGCARVAQYTVKRPLALEVGVNTRIDYDCASGVIKAISQASVSGGMAPYQLTWSAGEVSGDYNEWMETRQSGIILLTVRDQSGCRATHSFQVEIPTPGILSQRTDCNQPAFQFNGMPVIESTANTYSWDFGDGTRSNLRNPQHVYSAPGRYTVRLTIGGGNSCISVYEQEVNVEPPLQVGIDKDARFCKGDSILIYGTGAETYRWNDGTNGESIWIKEEGDYSVTGLSESGCPATYHFKASYYEPINYTIQSDLQEVSTGANRIHLWTENIPYSQYQWDFGDGETGQWADLYHTYEISDDGYFDVTLRVINPNGCVEETTKRIWKSIATIANTFTPNGDNINDIYLKGWQIEVFTRNGILMYKGDEGWDGKHNGRPVDNDTYFVIIYDSTQLGAKYKTGYVTVLR